MIQFAKLSSVKAVVGLDISAKAHEMAKNMHQKEAFSSKTIWLNADFFSYQPPTSFDLIFDYTFAILCLSHFGD
jgi:hypothetical protein